MSKRGLCKFFADGGCVKGEHCRFSHDLEAPPPKNICKLYQKGKCKYGGRCKYQHVEVSQSHSSGPSSSSEQKWLPTEVRCGIAIANPDVHYSGFAMVVPEEHQTGIAIDGPVKHRTGAAIASPSTSKAKSAESSSSDSPVVHYSGFAMVVPEEHQNGTAIASPVKHRTGIARASPSTTKAKTAENSRSYTAAIPLTGPSQRKLSGHYEARKTSDNDDYKQGADTAPKSLCPFLTAGFFPGGKRCRQVHLDLCSTCGKHCLNPLMPKEREEHMETCQKMQKQLEATRLSEYIECNVCLERILSKTNLSERKFGILPECDHPFCLSCIKNWRETSAASGLDVNSNACPTCRKVSYFVVPSNTWYSSEEQKHKIISIYKEEMWSIECHDFKFGNGVCPLGSNCFYKHTVRPGSSLWNARLGLGRYPNMHEEDEDDEDEEEEDDDDDGMSAFAWQAMLREASAFPDLYGPDICDLAGRIDNPDLRAIQLLTHHLYHPHPHDHALISEEHDHTPISEEHDEESDEDSADEHERILNECVQEYITSEYGIGPFTGWY